jgi:hypothetical protein
MHIKLRICGLSAHFVSYFSLLEASSPCASTKALLAGDKTFKVLAELSKPSQSVEVHMSPVSVVEVAAYCLMISLGHLCRSRCSTNAQTNCTSRAISDSGHSPPCR